MASQTVREFDAEGRLTRTWEEEVGEPSAMEQMQAQIATLTQAVAAVADATGTEVDLGA